MIFDCHVHLPSPGLRQNWEWQPFAPQLQASLDYLQRCRVDKILANSVRAEIADTAQEMQAGNNETYEIASRYPQYVIPTCLVNPNLHQESLEELKRCRHELGMVWIGELCGYISGFAYDTPAFADLVRVAVSLDMVIHIHNDDAADMARLCASFPQATFVLAHLGDNPDQVLERIALTAQYSNLYLDICGNGFERMGILEHAIKTAGEDRVLFGSDFTINDPSGVIARIRNSYLSDSVQEKIFSKNLARLLADRGVPV